MSMQVYAGTCMLNQVYAVYYLDYFPNGCKNTHLNDRFSVVIYSLEMYGNASEFVKTTSLAFAIFR